jgi:hypothetical protein
MTLLAEVVACLEHEGSQHAMIGATAMAALGAGRSTQDLDILTNDRAALRSARWRSLEQSGATVDIRHGDIQDPLVGVIRVSRTGERPVDVIVGEGAWQNRILEEASVRQISDVRVPVVDEIGLVLLKLYAGGPQDRWDIEQLMLQTADRMELEWEIGERVSDLPARCRSLWQRMLESSNDVSDE